MRLVEFFFKSLPDYFHIYDSYKRDDVVYNAGKGWFTDRDYGLLERYVAIFQEDAEQIDSQITGLKDLPFPLSCPETHLSFIASSYGYPPDTMGDVTMYRQLLRNIIDINRKKGTVEGINRFFGIMGVKADVTVVGTTPAYYDSDSLYDSNNLFYDSVCFPCVWVNITITEDLQGIFAPPYNDNQKRNIQSILKYLLPINSIIDEASGLDAWIVGAASQDIQITDNLLNFKRTP